VKSPKPNPFGLFEMYGGSTEWVWDGHAPYAADAVVDPVVPPGKNMRMWRGSTDYDHGGGAFWTVNSFYRHTNREYQKRSGHWGFGRVVISIPLPGTGHPGVIQPGAAIPPFSDADVQRIAALPAAAQVEEVRKELMKRNPGFDDNKVTHKIEDGVVTEIKVVTENVTDISSIRVFNSLRVLDFAGTAFQPETKRLSDLTPLKGMNLAGLSHLGLNWTQVGDAGLAHFKDCKKLTFLNLARTPVSDAGLFIFKDCTELASLSLEATQAGDEGVAHFKGCTNLIGLHLGGTKVTDTGLLSFKDCKKLTWLILSGTPVSDAGLAHLAGLDRLTKLILTKTQVTAKGVEELAKVLPKCKIEWDDGTIEPVSSAPFTDAEVKRIAALPAAKQVEEVRKELVRRNPGFDGKVEHKIENDIVTEFKLFTDEVVDISPVRALRGLVALTCSPTQLPGRRGKLADISPLQGLPLASLDLTSTQVTNIEVVKEMPLTHLNLDRTPVADLSPLTGKTLKLLNFGGTKVKSLSDVPIVQVDNLHCYLRQITDKSDLARRKVRYLDLWGVPDTVDPERLRELKPTLSRVNKKPLEDFLKEVAQTKAGLPPFTDADVHRIAALPAERQLDAVAEELAKRNPGLDVAALKTNSAIRDGKLLVLEISAPFLGDLTPLQLLPGLPMVRLNGTNGIRLSTLVGSTIEHLSLGGAITDLSELPRLPSLKVLEVQCPMLTDVTPLKGRQLRGLNLHNSNVEDLSPLKGMPLVVLNVHRTKVKDLSPLQGMKLESFLYMETEIQDISVLRDMPLQSVGCDFLRRRDEAVLKAIPTLTMINDKSAEEFWKDVKEK